MKIRPALPEDLAAVLEMRAGKAPPARPTRGITGEQRLAALLDSYRGYWKWVGQDPNFRVALAEDEHGLQGIFPVVTGSHDSITDEPQGLVLDLFARRDDPIALDLLVQDGEDFARRGQMDYLVADLDEEPLEAALTARGWIPDLNRIVMSTAQPPRVRDRYPIRPARSTDHFFILSLNSLVNANTIPPGRKVSPDHVSRGYMYAYTKLRVEGDPEMPTFISEDPARERCAGYLILKMNRPDPTTGLRSAYIYEIAVHPDYWGRRVVDDLLGTAARQLHPEGVAYFTGDVSQTNLRALKTAQRSLGFVIEQRRWSVALSTPR